MRYRQSETRLPGWLWFFLALPVGLVTVLLLRRRKAQLAPTSWENDWQQERYEEPVATRYTEPDSIPIDTRMTDEVQPTASADIEVPRDQDEIVLADTEPLPVERAERAAVIGSGAPDDLKLIEGIGPTISGLLRAHGIGTFAALAGASIDSLEAMLQEANLRRIANPETWPEQAAFAARGDFVGLEALQKTLKGGRRVRGSDEG